MDRLCRIFAAVCISVMAVISYADGQPRTLILASSKVNEARTTYAAKKLQSNGSFQSFMKEAEAALTMKPLSVMDKAQTPPSGSKHDYLSMGPYWWPDTTKPNGLPYIRRDGERNPEYHSITDPSEISDMIQAVQTLAAAFFITDHEPYAAKARTMLRVWFIDEATKMNPNMNYAQYIPGINSGRGIGIIETHDLYKVLDGIVLLRASRVWTQADDESMKAWFSEYYTWLTTSPYGMDESKEKNNHGSWYDVQVSALALFLGNDAAAKKILEAVAKKRIALQIEPDGKQPLELARTKSWGYSNYNLKALLHLALLGERAGVNLWHCQSQGGGSIRKAMEFLIPFVQNPEKWKYRQIEKMHFGDFFLNLHIAGQKYNHKTDAEWNAVMTDGSYSINFLDTLI